MERSALADFLGADKDEIVITANTTEGFGMIANGLELQEGDEILSTTQFSPYNAAWYVLRDRKKITLTEVELPIKPQTKQEIIDLFAQAITPQTKVMSFCHINYTNGLRMPATELCALAQQHGIVTLIDGAHAPGMIDFNLHDLGCVFTQALCINGCAALPAQGCYISARTWWISSGLLKLKPIHKGR